MADQQASVVRIDGSQKVTGAALYGADMAAANQAYAFLVTSPIAKGRITAIDDRHARAVRGFLDLVTWREIGQGVRAGKLFSGGGYLGSTIQPLTSDKVAYAGEIVAVVIAESFEAAREAAQALDVRYAAENPSASFDSEGTERSLRRTPRPSMRTPRSATRPEPSQPPNSRSTRNIPRPFSITIRSSFSRRFASGTEQISRSGSPRRT
jgi:CO/xanthine dehydrogenase Mo-binding subunit